MTLDIILITTTEQKQIFNWQTELLCNQTDSNYRLHVVSDMQRGEARNMGAVRALEADIFLFIDGDIFLSNDHVRYLKEFHKNNPKCTMYGRFLEIHKADTINDILEDPFYSYHAPLLMEDCNNVSNWQSYQSCCFSIERDWYKKLGGFDPIFQGWGGEDTDLFYRAEEIGMTLMYNPTLTFWHLNHGHKFHKDGVGQDPQVYKNMVQLFLKHPCKEVFDNIKGFFKMQYMNDCYADFVRDYGIK